MRDLDLLAKARGEAENESESDEEEVSTDTPKSTTSIKDALSAAKTALDFALSSNNTEMVEHYSKGLALLQEHQLSRACTSRQSNLKDFFSTRT